MIVFLVHLVRSWQFLKIQFVAAAIATLYRIGPNGCIEIKLVRTRRQPVVANCGARYKASTFNYVVKLFCTHKGH
jgi:hypothetical protein